MYRRYKYGSRREGEATTRKEESKGEEKGRRM